MNTDFEQKQSPTGRAKGNEEKRGLSADFADGRRLGINGQMRSRAKRPRMGADEHEWGMGGKLLD